MSANEERSETTVLYRLEESPNVLFGITSSELFMVFGSSIAIFVILLSIFLGLLGIALGFAAGGFFGMTIAKRIGVKKAGRESYLFWGEVKRNIQIDGINLLFTRLKIPFGFINSQRWDNVSHENRCSKLKD